MLDFSEEETDALARLLSRQSTTIVSPRIQISKAILGKFRPEPAHDPLPPLKRYEPPRATAARGAQDVR
jgi:hypothetical protein